MYMPGPTKLPADILNKIHALTNEKYFEYMEKLRRSSRCISLTGVDQKDCVVDDSAQEELPRSLDEVYSDEKLTKAEAKKQLAPVPPAHAPPVHLRKRKFETLPNGRPMSPSPKRCKRYWARRMAAAPSQPPLELIETKATTKDDLDVDDTWRICQLRAVQAEANASEMIAPGVATEETFKPTDFASQMEIKIVDHSAYWFSVAYDGDEEEDEAAESEEPAVMVDSEPQSMTTTNLFFV